MNAEALARLFHETYEHLAPEYNYETRRKSRVPWEQVPENNRQLMTAVAEVVLARWAQEDGPACETCWSRDPKVRGAIPRSGWYCGCGIGVRHVASCGRPRPYDPCTDAFHEPAKIVQSAVG